MRPGVVEENVSNYVALNYNNTICPNQVTMELD